MTDLTNLAVIVGALLAGPVIVLILSWATKRSCPKCGARMEQVDGLHKIECPLCNHTENT